MIKKDAHENMKTYETLYSKFYNSFSFIYCEKVLF